jgi:thioesterase domain-containing protein
MTSDRLTRPKNRTNGAAQSRFEPVRGPSEVPPEGKDSGSGSAPDAPNSHDAHARMKNLANVAFVREALRMVTDVIVPLNDSGPGPAFYCVHCITGVAASFRSMARMLGPQQRFYGIQAPTSKRNAEFASSIESVSRHYVDELVRFQPEGNLVLGGYSTGAVIALEMAQQLRARGREVCQLIVFDGLLYNTGAEISYRHPSSWLKLIWNMPHWIAGVMTEGYSFRTLFRKACNEAVTAIAEMVDGSRARRLCVEKFSNIDLNSCSRDHVAFINSLFEQQFDYIPMQYDGRVLVYTTKAQRITRQLQMEAAWRKIAPQSKFVYVMGSHTSMMRFPEGAAMAKHMTKRIAESL